MTTISPTQNQQKSSNPYHPSLVTKHCTPITLTQDLREFGCNGCSLGHEYLAPVIYRGNPKSNKVILGEAPGLYEAQDGLPFVGPAGKLLDKIWAAVGWDTNDWYLSNIVKCRPIAAPNSGRQNNTPEKEHRLACAPILQQELRSLAPTIVVLLGKSALAGLFPEYTNQPVGKLVGKVLVRDEYPDTTFFVMYHPAYILRAQHQPTRGNQVRAAMWEHIQLLRDIVEEM